jgi:RNA polymerase sigma-70 factor (ECF subfamily)
MEPPNKLLPVLGEQSAQSVPSQTDPAECTESRLMHLVQCHDERACELFYGRHKGRAYGVILRLVGDRATAEDLLQETFLQVFREIGRFRALASVDTWIYRIAVNFALDELQKRRRRRLAELANVSVESDDGRQAQAAGAFEASVLEQLVESLPSRQRTAIVLHTIYGLSFEEIADLCRRRLNTVKSDWWRGASTLRQKRQK